MLPVSTYIVNSFLMLQNIGITFAVAMRNSCRFTGTSSWKMIGSVVQTVLTAGRRACCQALQS